MHAWLNNLVLLLMIYLTNNSVSRSDLDTDKYIYPNTIGQGILILLEFGIA